MVGIPPEHHSVKHTNNSIQSKQETCEFAERIVRGEILAAYQRFEAASRAVATLENAALPRSMQNVETCLTNVIRTFRLLIM